jgi:F0F1-type ATP synthase assembly protein I
VLLDPELLKKTGVFALASSQLVAYVVSGYFLGNWLDKSLGTAPLFVASLSLAGFGYSCWRLIVSVKSEK